jgi:hypothetical protein
MEKETLEEAAREYWKRCQFGLEKAADTERAFLKGGLWQAKRMYSEEEVRVLIEKALTHNDYDLCGSLATKDQEIRTANFEVWFGQFKKKEL